MDTALVGSAGEHYVAFRLSAMGFAVALTARAVKGVDLLVANLTTQQAAQIQVKTALHGLKPDRQGCRWWTWSLGKPPASPSANFFYVFVDLEGNDVNRSPTAFILPSTELIVPILDLYPKAGPPHTSAWCVLGESHINAYLNRWDIIEEALSEPPVHISE